ncbi:MAG TPA: glycosyl transferase family 1, partial [Myxococcaceae bacterium]|nr:glycosyl transferase family 1 [Myxococcaceae bacterium]
TGLLVPPCDSPALAAAIRRLLDAPELGTALGRAGREHLLAAHGWPQAISGMVSVLAPPLPKR